MPDLEIAKKPDAFWGFAYVHPRCEKKVAETLSGSGVTCYLPTLPHAYMMHYTKVVTSVPMFPGYVFLCAGREEACSIRYRERKILRIDLQFDALRETTLIAELNAVQIAEKLARTEEVLVKPGIVPGDKVEITSGAMKGLAAEVVRRDDAKDMVVINVTMLDQHIEFPVFIGDLEKMTD